MLRKLAAGALTLAGAFTPLRGATPPPLVPFVLPWNDATAGPTDLSAMDTAPAGSRGFVHAGPGGHLYAGDQRVRLFGVNITFGGCCPPKEVADAVAARLAKFGVNCVRLHHADSLRAPDGLLAYHPDSRTFDPAALDRFDYFISRLEAHGIYADINLFVGRRFTPADGLPGAVKGVDDLIARKAMGMFDPRMIALQQDYARTLLGHRNPYTGRTYAQDPGVAIVEVMNEAGLIHAWLCGAVDTLPPVFRDELAVRWQAWLKRRYKSTADLRAAWGAVTQPLGDSMLRGKTWQLEVHNGAAANVTQTGGSARIHITRIDSVGWHVQYHAAPIKLEASHLYTVRLRLRADRPMRVSVSLGQNHEPWGSAGYARELHLTTEWQTIEDTVQAPATDGNVRFDLGDLGRQIGEVSMKDAELRPGGSIGTKAGESLETGTLALPEFATRQGMTAAQRRDWIAFLCDTEGDDWRAMRHTIKDELQFKGVVVGTIVGCSTPNLMSEFDAIDAHAYWQHPQFPGRPWDPANWHVRNVSMVNTPWATLGNLGVAHVAGKPMIITEYNHPAPNTYGSEAPLMLAAFAAAQDFDGIFIYSYHHGPKDWDRGSVQNYFDIDHDPEKMVTARQAAVIFRRGDVPPFSGLQQDALPPQKELDLIAERGGGWRLCDPLNLGVDPTTLLSRRFELVLHGKPHDVAPSGGPEAVRFDTSVKGRGVMTVNAARVKMVVGFADGRRFDLGGVVIEPGPTMQGWCTVSLSASGGSFTAPGRVIVSVTGYGENTGMGWKDAQKSTVGRDWGGAPTLVEVPPVKLTLPVKSDRVTGWALDEKGQHAEPLAVIANPSGGAVIDLGPPHRTLWYELVVR